MGFAQEPSQIETAIRAVGALGSVGTMLALLGFLARMVGHDRKQLTEADNRFKKEAAAHAVTDAQLDQERKLRRQAEDALAKVGRQVEALTAQIASLNAQVAAQAAQIAAQTEQITAQKQQIAMQTERILHLEQEVARLGPPPVGEPGR
ncbi:hypothetical protein ACQSSU_20785 [Micromonospora echinospora]